jgi:hypothetical protein
MSSAMIKKALIVEDDPHVLGHIEDTLCSLNHEHVPSCGKTPVICCCSSGQGSGCWRTDNSLAGQWTFRKSTARSW